MATKKTEKTTKAAEPKPAKRAYVRKACAAPAAEAPASVECTAEKKKVAFAIDVPLAGSVFVAGSFNNWDPQKTAMKKDKKGVWTKSLSLEPGTYEYKFIVDGEWVNDPANANKVTNEFGTNDIITV